MKEWRQTITSICTVVLAIAALATMMQFQFAGVRAEMRAEHDVIRMQMRDEHAAMRGEHTAMRGEHTAMRGEHTAMRGEHADVRDQVISVDRRTARIEGHLFGIEIAPDQEDSD
ncbi:hypothetical protein [Candidatus Rariloculus sp.]|uniref:hypothetical protein n=1 Tax=Candidatus Rariloculus sp. TaxID=3101265 RepID=UPI003D0B7080